MRHDHIEAILREEERDRQQDVVRPKRGTNAAHHSAGNVYMSCLTNIGPPRIHEPLRDTVGYLVIHNGSQAHDAHMHVILLADKSGVLDGFAAGD